jgi:hypothetical protein
MQNMLVIVFLAALLITRNIRTSLGVTIVVAVLKWIAFTLGAKETYAKCDTSAQYDRVYSQCLARGDAMDACKRQSADSVGCAPWSNY